MVKLQFSKLVSRVRFPPPAPRFSDPIRDSRSLGDDVTRGAEGPPRGSVVPEIHSNRDIIGGVHKAEVNASRSFALHVSSLLSEPKDWLALTEYLAGQEK